MRGQLLSAITLLMLLMFMIIQFFQFRFAEVVDAKTSVEESPLAAQGTAPPARAGLVPMRRF